MGSRGVPWIRDEVTLALRVYKKLGKIPDEHDPYVMEVARLTGRSPDSIVYKIANLRFLDSGGTKGLKHIGKIDRLVWQYFNGNDGALEKEADRVADQLSRSDPFSESERGRGGQGFTSSSEGRKKIEAFAMSKAIDYFSGRGYSVSDTHSNSPYDLKCVKDGDLRFVEVKGTSGDGSSVLLTAGEVIFARLHPKQMALFVVHSIREEVDHLAGTVKVIIPWKINDEKLAPYNFAYEI